MFKGIWYLNRDTELLESLAQMTDIVIYSHTPGDYSRMLKSVFGPGSGRDCCMAVFRLGKGWCRPWWYHSWHGTHCRLFMVPLDYSEVALFRHFISIEKVTEILHIDWGYLGCPFRFLPQCLALSIFNISHHQTISIVLRLLPGHFSCLAAGLRTLSSLVVPNSGLWVWTSLRI